MKPLNVYISTDTKEDDNFKRWIGTFAETIRNMLQNHLGQATSTSTSYDKNETSLINEADIVLMIIAKDDRNQTRESELNLIITQQEKKNIPVFNLNFTGLEHISINEKIKAEQYDFNLKNPMAEIDFNNQEDYETERVFWLKLVDLTLDICKIYEENKENEKKRVFIGESSPDIQYERDAIIRELHHNGIEVIKSQSSNLTLEEFEAKTNEALDKADIIINLIGGETAPRINGQDTTSIQNRLASAYCKETGKNNRLIWIPENLLIKNEQQRLLIEKLRRDNLSLTGAEIIQMPLESFKDVLLERVRKSHQELRQQDDHYNIYIVHHNGDKASVNKLIDSLKQPNIKISQAPGSDNKKELLYNHWQNLLYCDSVILFYDARYPEWLDSKHKDIIKSTGLGRKEAIGRRYLIVPENATVNDSLKKDFEIVSDTPKDLENLSKKIIKQN